MTQNIIRAVGIMLLSATTLMAAPPERWIHVRVETANGAGGLTFNVPIGVASVVLPAIAADQQRQGKFNIQASVNGVDLRAVLDAVRNSPDGASMTMERHGKNVNVSKSGEDLLIKISGKPGAEPRFDETIILKVPIPVLKAMVGDNPDELDVGAGIRALARQGDVDVTVNKQKETVRVWTDTRTTSD